MQIRKLSYLGLFFFVLVLIVCQKQDVEITGEFAPPDAYVEGSPHPYYGSENPWDRRFFYDQIGFEYKRRGQRQMLDLVEVRPVETVRYCNELLSEDPNDQESLFNLAVAQASLGELDNAMQTVKKAVAAGLPFSRFLAGPRDILKPLTESKKFKSYALNFSVELLHGPMLGNVTAESATFWVRTLHEVPVQVVVSPTETFTAPMKSNTGETKAENDFTVVVNIAGLQPHTKYYYNILLNNQPVYHSDFPTVQTYPTGKTTSKIQVAFGGGAGYYLPNERVWKVLSEYQLNGLLLLGDNVYINMPEMPNGVHYYTYSRRQSQPDFRKLVASTPVYAIWDDHDCATDDVWMGPYREKPVWKIPLFEVFRENWNNPRYGDTEWPGCWFSFSIGEVDFFMLDGRFYRTNPYDENPTMLGPVQKKWLLNQLKASQATFKVIASPVPWSLATKGEARDTWNGFKRERQEIFDFLAENLIDGVILLSADRHRSDAWRIERNNGYPLFEFESSRLTNQHVHELMPGALFGYNEKQSFGLLTFDTIAEDPTVTYQIISIDNEIIHTLELNKSKISH